MRTSQEMKRADELEEMFKSVTKEIEDRSVYNECMRRLAFNFVDYEKENDCTISNATTQYDNIGGWLGCKLAVHTDKGVKYQYFSLDKPIPVA